MASVYVDTNIFLDFYRRSENSLAIFQELRKLGQRLVFTEQTLAEFERNRAQGLKVALGLLATIKLAWNTPPDLIGALPEFKEVDRARKQVDSLVDKMKQKIDGYSKDDASDPVLAEFRALTQSARRLETKPENIERAQRRKLLGHPPFSSDKVTIGDELIWETLVEGCNDDLIICSRDATFATHEPFLRAEYQGRVKKNLTVIDGLSLALKAAGADDTQVKKEEKALAEQQQSAQRDRAEAMHDVQRAFWVLKDGAIPGTGAANEWKTLLDQLLAGAAGYDINTVLTPNRERAITGIDLYLSGRDLARETLNGPAVGINVNAVKPLHEQTGGINLNTVKPLHEQAGGIHLNAVKPLPQHSIGGIELNVVTPKVRESALKALDDVRGISEAIGRTKSKPTDAVAHTEKLSAKDGTDRSSRRGRRGGSTRGKPKKGR